MTYRDLLRRLSKMSQEDLDQEIEVFEDDNTTHASFLGFASDPDYIFIQKEYGYGSYCLVVG